MSRCHSVSQCCPLIRNSETNVKADHVWKTNAGTTVSFLPRWNTNRTICSASLSILHIYTAKGLRECAFAAAERLRDVGKLDAREHKGKVFQKTDAF